MKFANIFAAAVLTLSAGMASAQESSDPLDNTPSGGAMAVDLLLIRPVALVGTVLGVGLFVLQLPISIIQGEAPIEPARKLVVEPAKYTFTRRLGSTENAPIR